MISRNLSGRLWSGRTERFLSIRAVFLSNGGDAAWTAKKCWELSRKAHRHLEAHWAVRLLMLSWFSKLRNGRRYFSVFSEILEDQQQWIITKKVKNLLATCVGGIVKKSVKCLKMSPMLAVKWTLWLFLGLCSSVAEKGKQIFGLERITGSLRWNSIRITLWCMYFH